MRGDVHRYRGDRAAKGREQQGARFAVVVQSDALEVLSTWLIAPTSTGARPGPIRPTVSVSGQQTQVLVERLTAVDPQLRLGERVERLTPGELAAVDEALRLALGLF